MDPTTAPRTSLRSALRWGTAGAVVGVAAALGAVLVARAVAASATDGRVLSTAYLSLTAAAAVLLGILVGSGVGYVLPMGVRGGAFAVVGAVGAVLVGPVTPLLPAPVLLSAGAMAAGRDPWVRVVGFGGLLLGVASLVAFPAAAWLSTRGGGAGTAFVLGLAAAAVTALVAYRRLGMSRRVDDGA